MIDLKRLSGELRKVPIGTPGVTATEVNVLRNAASVLDRIADIAALPPGSKVLTCRRCGTAGRWMASFPFGGMEPDGHVCANCNAPMEAGYFKEV